MRWFVPPRVRSAEKDGAAPNVPATQQPSSTVPPSARRKAKQQSRRARPRIGSFERLESREVLSVTFHGGALLKNVEAQAVFLGSDWKSNSSLDAQAKALDQYVNYLVQSPYMDMLTNAGYNVGQGSATAGQELNLSLNKSSGITDAQIHTDLQTAISSGVLAAPDANRLYVVYVEPGVNIKDGTDSSATSFLGYHGAFAGKDATGKAVDIRYAVMAYPGPPNPTSTSQGFATSFDQLTAVASHEIAEAVTDPDVNYKRLGWYDDQLNGEIGDLTSRTTVLNGYVVQDLVGKNDQVIVPVAGTGGTGGSGGTGGTTTLAAPQILSTSALSFTSAQITWGSVEGAAGYRVFLVNGTTSTLIGTLGASATSATVTGLAAGSKNSFKIEAFSGATVADSAVVSVQLPAQQVIVAPTNVSATALSSTSAQLTWSGVAGATGYRVFQVNGSQVTLLGTLGSSARSATVVGLTAGTTASFEIEAFNSTSQADSAMVSVDLPAAMTLTPPQVTATAVSSSVVQLAWNSITGAQGYRIYWWNGFRAVYLGSVGAATTSVRIGNLPAGATNQFLVEAYSGSAFADSDWVSATSTSSARKANAASYFGRLA